MCGNTGQKKIFTIITPWKAFKTCQFCHFLLSKWMKNWSWMHYCRKQSAFLFLQATLSLPWHKRLPLLKPYMQSYKCRRDTSHLSSLGEVYSLLHTYKLHSNNECCVYTPALLIAPWRPDPNPENITSTAPNSEIHLQSFVHSVSVPVQACEHQLNNQIQAMWELFTRAFSSTSLEGMKTHLKIWTP